MKLEELYDFLAAGSFQDRRTGNLFFPVYIYTYPPEMEYEIREHIAYLVEQLQRPSNYLDCMVLNIYEEMIRYVKETTFRGKSLFDEIAEKEKESPEEAEDWFQDEIDSPEFIEFIRQKVNQHFADRSDQTRAYLLLHGFGDAFPHLRTSTFLKRTESLVKDFKMIVFYPGDYDGKHYRMFTEIANDNVYRATRLNEL